MVGGTRHHLYMPRATLRFACRPSPYLQYSYLAQTIAAAREEKKKNNPMLAGLESDDSADEGKKKKKKGKKVRAPMRASAHASQVSAIVCPQGSACRGGAFCRTSAQTIASHYPCPVYSLMIECVHAFSLDN